MELAVIKEINQEYIEAVKCYENDINNGRSITDSFINLAFLYWAFAFDVIEVEIPGEWSIIGGNRYPEIIELGLNKYPNCIELKFWKIYFSHIIHGESFSETDCIELLKYEGNKSNVAYFFLYLYDKVKYEENKILIMNECKRQPTAKNIYVESIIRYKEYMIG